MMEEVMGRFMEGVQGLQNNTQQLVYKSDLEASKKTGFGRTYWDRAKREPDFPKLPVVDDEGNVTYVYPVAQVEEWIKKHTLNRVI